MCLSFSSHVVHLFKSHLALRWLESPLQLSNVRVRIMEGNLLCLELIYRSGTCVYVSVSAVRFLLRRSQILCHMSWELGRGAAGE